MTRGTARTRADSSSRAHLPAELSSFVGRRHELSRLRRMLREHRLVTLFGPGGVGKTRLALRAAAELSSEFADGAWVAELAHVTDPALVPDTVVAALGLRDGDMSSAAERLVDHLAPRETLLVLDNCEHVESATARLLSTLLRSCPRLRVVATSRHRLVVEGETLLPVPPLSMPETGREGRSAEGLLRYDAVRLFVDRATQSFGGFQVDESNQEALGELVRRLDGVPLAIELASVRVRSLTVEQILDRLTDRFALLSKGSRVAVPRQRTLRALLDWSHDLLTEPERLVWCRSTVFSGSFDLEALQRVVCDDVLPADTVEEHVASLVAKSILVRDDRPGGASSNGHPEGQPAAPRFRMLESLREYGQGRLEAAELAAFSRRHLDYYAELTARAAREMYGADDVAWFERLTAEHDNLRLALEHCASEPELAGEGLRLMSRLLHYWVMVGRFSEGRRWLGRLLDHPGGAAVERAAGSVVAGRLAVLQGDVETGRPLLEQALARATVVGSTTWRAHALHGLAIAAAFWSEPAEAVTLLDEALALHRLGDDPFGVPLALVQLASVHASLGHLDVAMAYAEECIGLSEPRHERWCAGLARWAQALVAWRQGRGSAARGFARKALELKTPFGDRLGMAMSMEIVAWDLAAQGRSEESAALIGAVDTALSTVGGGLFRYLHGDRGDCVAKLRDALGPSAYDAAYQRGAALSFADAIALAAGRRLGGAGGAPLTPRETEIAHLVAGGMSNREVAERLVTSRRTVEGHVARILTKLGLESRTQLAAWVAEQSPKPVPEPPV